MSRYRAYDRASRWTTCNHVQHHVYFLRVDTRAIKEIVPEKERSDSFLVPT